MTVAPSCMYNRVMITNENTLNNAPVTLAEAQELIMRGGKAESGARSGNVIGYALLGSSLYGLNTAESDRDIFVLTDVKVKKDFHKVYEDGADLRVTSIYAFADSLVESQPSAVDLLMSNTITMEHKGFEAYLKSIRFNTMWYIDKNRSHAMQDTANSLKDFKNEKRAKKSLKTAFRNIILTERVLAQGTQYKSFFNTEQRDGFYKSLETLYKLREEKTTTEHLLTTMTDLAQELL